MNTKQMNDSKRTGAGRPALAPGLKKVKVGLKMRPWLNEWLNEQSESKISLIEKALIEYYNLEKV